MHIFTDLTLMSFFLQYFTKKKATTFHLRVWSISSEYHSEVLNKKKMRNASFIHHRDPDTRRVADQLALLSLPVLWPTISRSLS